MSSDPDKALDERESELWSGCTPAFVDHARNPRNVGSIPNSDGFGSVVSDCGDTMGIWLKVNGGVIRGITFWTDGCFSAIATGSVVTELAKGRSVPEALGISHQRIALTAPCSQRTRCTWQSGTILSTETSPGNGPIGSNDEWSDCAPGLRRGLH